MRPESATSDQIMMLGNDVAATTKRKTGWRGWYKPVRCSVCTSFIWFHPIALDESVRAPEPRCSWILCKPCYRSLLVEMRRSSIRSPARLRIALGLVAAERSPRAYNTEMREAREFAWAMWLIALFSLLHLVIFALLLMIRK